MEKRLRRLEDSVHYLVAGKEVKPEPCAGNFTRVGSGCYLLSGEGGDWKAASVRCRKLRAHLLEIDSSDERRALFSLLLSKDQFICELPEDRGKVSNEIDRAARALRDLHSTARQARTLLERR
ncbi:hypothetical protein evm_014974 [Chilo suppressalis]|nr:hypothetical protein evm_014974 [Chilo suppressalis]